jgi:hypothetical protein
MAVNILIAVLGGGNLLLFIKFLIERHDRKHETIEENELGGINDRLGKLEKDGIRTQLLLLILLRPDEQTEILKVAEHYFCKLKANWYMTSMFKKWCDEQGLEPEWFED